MDYLGCIFIFLQFCNVASHSVNPPTRGKNQIWLQVKEFSTHFLEFYYVLASSKNTVSKYGNFHVFVFRNVANLLYIHTFAQNYLVDGVVKGTLKLPPFSFVTLPIQKNLKDENEIFAIDHLPIVLC